MKTLINLIVFLSLVSFATISCTKEDANTEITDSIINLDTSKYAFSNNVEFDLRKYYQIHVSDTLFIIEDQVILDTFPFDYHLVFDLLDQQFKQSLTTTTDLYTRQVNFNGDIITNDSLFVNDGTHLVPNYMYITQEPATNNINIYTHYRTPGFTYDLYYFNVDSTANDGITYSYLSQDPLPLPVPSKPAVNFHNDDYPITSTIIDNTFSLNGSILYAGQQTSSCQISENYDTIVGDFSGTIKVTYRFHYIDPITYPLDNHYIKVFEIVDYKEIENGDLFMTEKEF